ncbi:hypothetical protein VII_000601 [Vibrio mimicus MB451]|nr:hypothetical protein VII_000601 [Vibrio mimicus MB451]
MCPSHDFQVWRLGDVINDAFKDIVFTKPLNKQNTKEKGLIAQAFKLLNSDYSSSFLFDAQT